MKKKLYILLAMVFCLSSLVITASAASLNFSDVPRGAWYYDNVYTAVDMGLVNGKSNTSYAPDANLTYAEAVKLAACMNQRYVDGMVTLTSGDPWYSTYVDYCKAGKIITKDYAWDAPATRSGYMEIFANALPDSALKAINTVKDGSIPDVPGTHPSAAAIYKLYRAGIVTGVDSQHNCNPTGNIKRSEVAAILVRMMETTQRQSFSMDGSTGGNSTGGDSTGGNSTGGNSTGGDSTATSPLKITSQPKDHQMTSSSNNVTFSVSVSGGKAPYTYQWYMVKGQSNEDQMEQPTSGSSTTDSITTKITDYTFDDADAPVLYVYCEVKDSTGAKVNSREAEVHQYVPTSTASPLKITAQPEDHQMTSSSNNVTFSVSVSGGKAPYTYQWYMVKGQSNEDQMEQPTSGSSTTNSITTKITDYTFDDADAPVLYVYCEVKDSTGAKVNSREAEVHQYVSTSTASPLKITKGPEDARMAASNSTNIHYSIAIEGGKGPYIYQLLVNGKVYVQPGPTNNMSQDFNLQITNGEIHMINGDRVFITYKVQDSLGNTVTSERATLWAY